MKPVSEDIRNKRIEACESCEHFMDKVHVCKSCGCFLPVKTWMDNAECPEGKWDADS